MASMSELHADGVTDLHSFQKGREYERADLVKALKPFTKPCGEDNCYCHEIYADIITALEALEYVPQA
jgi:hypothetical protein